MVSLGKILNFHRWFCIQLSTALLSGIYSLRICQRMDALSVLQCMMCWCPATCVQTHRCGPMTRCWRQLYPACDELTTRGQADHHVFCQPFDILIRLFKIDTQKADHNSWGLISVDLPFLYFLGEKPTPVVWKMQTIDCLQCLFSVLKDADLPQMRVPCNTWNTVHSTGGKSADAAQICMRWLVRTWECTRTAGTGSISK